MLASSGGIYAAHTNPLAEDMVQSVELPLNFYAASKYCAELIFQSFRQFFSTAVSLRPFFMYGPGQGVAMLIPRLVASVREGRPITLQGAEGLRLNPIWIDDAVRAFSSAIELSGSHIINVAGPETLTLREIGERIGRVLGRKPEFETTAGDAKGYVADIGRMVATLGTPRTRFDEGIIRTIKPQ